ncbi:DUF2817 domain-containing protein [Winogradskyella eckloniae]|nr:DUF2817 domain-containing protein [Winogradskyella eckloniae]
MTAAHLNALFTAIKTTELFGRYITNTHIENCFSKFSESRISTIGNSVEGRPIYSFKFGNGPKKILLWSQMHGNESTSTKALFDCFNLFETEHDVVRSILDQCTLLVVPILNPDGAQKYTRVNANLVDLNRDAQDLSQPESQILRAVYNKFAPNYCFNLHGQRTIFSAGETNKIATLSFLSPAQDEDRSLTTNRKIAMAIIAEINAVVQEDIPNGVGRYDDGFNLNCVGDTFQNFGVPTLLYEAGHFANDYERETVRRLMFMAILKGLHVISEGVNATDYKAYLNIPENGKCFNDVILRNVKLKSSDTITTDVAFQFKEVLIDDAIQFIPVVEAISNLDHKYGHKEISGNGKIVRTLADDELKIGNEIDFVLLNNERISIYS